jgi:prefoldin subunit 5
MQQAIEFYNREKDEENQSYYVEKLSKLNDTIRELVDRQQRLQQKNTKKSPSPENPNLIR